MATPDRRSTRLVVVEDAGHYPHAEQPDSFFPAVESFLAQ
jgi:pimeloyl-ACP methyl ester carboxylesterase